MSKSNMILRTKFIDRACHWTVVISFFLVSLSGRLRFLSQHCNGLLKPSVHRKWDEFYIRLSE